MKVRKVLGGFAWAMLAAMLILVNAMAANGDDLFDQTENSNVSAVQYCLRFSSYEERPAQMLVFFDAVKPGLIVFDKSRGC